MKAPLVCFVSTVAWTEEHGDLLRSLDDSTLLSLRARRIVQDEDVNGAGIEAVKHAQVPMSPVTTLPIPADDSHATSLHARFSKDRMDSMRRSYDDILSEQQELLQKAIEGQVVSTEQLANSSGLTEAFNTMEASLKQEAREQKDLIKEANDHVMACTEDSYAQGDLLKSKDQQVKNLKEDHNTCRSDESKLKGDKTEGCSAHDSAMTKARERPSCLLEKWEDMTDEAVAKCIKDSRAWLDTVPGSCGSTPDLDAMREECAEKTTGLAALSPTCDKKQVAFEHDICSFQELLHLECLAEEEKCDRAAERRNRMYVAMNHMLNHCQHVYVTMERIKCIVHSIHRLHDKSVNASTVNATECLTAEHEVPEEFLLETLDERVAHLSCDQRSAAVDRPGSDHWVAEAYPSLDATLLAESEPCQPLPSGASKPAGPIGAEIIEAHNEYDSRFLAKNVLDATWQGGSHNNGQTWLTKSCNDGWFIMKLEDDNFVQEFHLLNTCNTPYNDRSTKDFTIWLSMNNEDWTTALKGSLSRCTPIKGEPLKFQMAKPMKSRYVKFVMDQCYGSSGGLNYFQAFGSSFSPASLPPAEAVSAQVISEDNTYDSRFLARNVLDASWQGGSHYNGQTWLTRSCDRGHFIMKLPSITMVQEFHLLNTCNTPYNDRSTKDFSIFVSMDNNEYSLAYKGSLDRCTPIKGEPLVFKNTGPMQAQYVKFVMDKCHGASGGLNYFQPFGSALGAKPKVTKFLKVTAVFGNEGYSTMRNVKFYGEGEQIGSKLVNYQDDWQGTKHDWAACTLDDGHDSIASSQCWWQGVASTRDAMPVHDRDPIYMDCASAEFETHNGVQTVQGKAYPCECSDGKYKGHQCQSTSANGKFHCHWFMFQLDEGTPSRVVLGADGCGYKSGLSYAEISACSSFDVTTCDDTVVGSNTRIASGEDMEINFAATEA